VRHKAIVVVVLTTSVLVGIGAVAAYAAIPTTNGTIHGCYRTSNPAKGALIVIDDGQTCPSGTAPLNWDADGPDYEYYFEYLPTSGGYVAIEPGGKLSTMVSCPGGKTSVSSNWELETRDPDTFYLVYQNTPNTSDPAAWDFGIANPTSVTIYVGGSIGVVCSSGGTRTVRLPVSS